jgi:predicted metalloprotease
VVAHELDHHVQTLTGITQQVDAARAAEPALNNALSVPLELRADCPAASAQHRSSFLRGFEAGDPNACNTFASS